MMKKWWILAVVFTLALSLTSCSDASNLQTGNAGQQSCSGTKGNFLISLNQVSNGMYEITLDPQTVTTEGIQSQIALVDSSGANKIVDTESLFQGTPVNIGPVSVIDLQNYNYLVIATFNPGVQFLQETGAEFCNLPFPGDSANGD